MAASHIPTSPALLGLTCAELIVAVTELGLLGWTQSKFDKDGLDTFAGLRVVPAAIGVGLFTTCLSLIYAIYFFVTTRTIYNGYSRIVALVMAAVSCAFWLATWGMLTNVLTLYNTTLPVPRYSSSGTYEGDTFEPVRTRFAEGIYGAILGLAIVEWLLFLASAVLLFRSPQRGARSHPDLAQKDDMQETTSTAV